MRVITLRDAIKLSPVEFINRCRHHLTNEQRDALERLKLLDLDTCSAKDVTTCLGIYGWHLLHCDGCELDVVVVVQFLEEGEGQYDANDCKLCMVCLQKGAAAILTAKDRYEEDLLAHVEAMVPQYMAAMQAKGKEPGPVVPCKFCGGTGVDQKDGRRCCAQACGL